jgi:hypothetical protein
MHAIMMQNVSLENNVCQGSTFGGEYDTVFTNRQKDTPTTVPTPSTPTRLTTIFTGATKRNVIATAAAGFVGVTVTQFLG